MCEGLKQLVLSMLCIAACILVVANYYFVKLEFSIFFPVTPFLDPIILMYPDLSSLGLENSFLLFNFQEHVTSLLLSSHQASHMPSFDLELLEPLFILNIFSD